MAAGPALEMWSKQTGTADSPDGKQRNVSMIRAFTVTLAAQDPLEVAYYSSGLPLVGDPYPGTLFVICRNLAAQRLAPTLAMVSVTYSGEVGPSGEGSSPIANETTVSWSGQISDEAIDQDINGKPIVTANGEPIDGLTERIPDQVAVIEKNFASINTYGLTQYLKSRNSDTFLGWPPGTVRFWEYSATNVITDGVAGFWKVSGKFIFREPYNTTPDKTWHKRVRHEGFLVRSVAGGTPRIAFDRVTKTPVTRPILLKADGTRETDPDNAHWLEFETTRALPYSALGFF
jgi:hypothetical protein